MTNSKMKVSRTFLFVLCSIIDLLENATSQQLNRKRRYLLFPTGVNIMQLIIGIGVPVELKPEAIIVGWAFRAFYTLPDNTTELKPMDYGESRRKRSLSRWSIYKMLESESEMRGYGGRSCILRTICEAADTPLDKYHGLFEELIHSLLTPTTTTEDLSHHTDNEYFAAQRLGRKYRGKCVQFFPECKLSILDILTNSLDDSPI